MGRDYMWYNFESEQAEDGWLWWLWREQWRLWELGWALHRRLRMPVGSLHPYIALARRSSDQLRLPQEPRDR